MKPEITEFTATVDGATCAFKRKGSGFPQRPFVEAPAGTQFVPLDVWTVTHPDGCEVRLTVPPGSDVDAVCAAADRSIRRRNYAAFRILRGHLVGDWSHVSDAEFFDVYAAAGAEGVLRGGDRHRVGMTSFSEMDGTRRVRSR